MGTKVVKSFVKEVLARINGDTDSALAERNYRLATAAVEGQLSNLNGEKVRAEVDLETAKDKLSAAIYPTTMIKDASAYNRNIVERQEKVDEAQEKLDDIEASIAYFKSLSEKINS